VGEVLESPPQDRNEAHRYECLFSIVGSAILAHRASLRSTPQPASRIATSIAVRLDLETLED
jgi:hypothetical protein